jgi:hypothetical protein
LVLATIARFILSAIYRLDWRYKRKRMIILFSFYSRRIRYKQRWFHGYTTLL